MNKHCQNKPDNQIKSKNPKSGDNVLQAHCNDKKGLSSGRVLPEATEQEYRLGMFKMKFNQFN